MRKNNTHKMETITQAEYDAIVRGEEVPIDAGAYSQDREMDVRYNNFKAGRSGGGVVNDISEFLSRGERRSEAYIEREEAQNRADRLKKEADDRWEERKKDDTWEWPRPTEVETLNTDTSSPDRGVSVYLPDDTYPPDFQIPTQTAGAWLCGLMIVGMAAFIVFVLPKMFP